jgi:hypothetical protein
MAGGPSAHLTGPLHSPPCAPYLIVINLHNCTERTTNRRLAKKGTTHCLPNLFSLFFEHLTL